MVQPQLHAATFHYPWDTSKALQKVGAVDQPDRVLSQVFPADFHTVCNGIPELVQMTQLTNRLYLADSSLPPTKCPEKTDMTSESVF